RRCRRPRARRHRSPRWAGAAAPEAATTRPGSSRSDRPARGTEALEFHGLYRSARLPAPNREPLVFGYNSTTAKVAELVDALDLGSSAERHVGSSPYFRTRSLRAVFARPPSAPSA